MPSTYVHHRRVEFADTDMAGIMHFSNYFRYMESAEHAFFAALGIPVDGDVKWPRVHAECTYRRGLRFRDDVAIHVSVVEKRRSSVTLRYSLRSGGEEAAHGSARIACTVFDPALGRLKSIPIPSDIDQRLEVQAPA